MKICDFFCLLISCHKFNKFCATVLLSLTFLLSSCINVSAAGSPYMGELQLFGGGLNVGINMYANYLPDVNDVEYIHVNYKGSGGSAIGLATQKGYGYNGRLEIYGTFVQEMNPFADASATHIDYWMSDVSAPEGVTVIALIQEREIDRVKVKYIIDFDNYIATGSDLHISFTDNFSQDFYTMVAETDATMGLIGSLFYRLNCTVSDWAGNLMEYSNPELMPGAEWVNVSVGNKIFNLLNSIDTRVLTFMKNVGTYFGSLTDHINFNFQTLFQKMDADQDELLAQDQQQHMEQSAQSSEQHDQLLNGYDQDSNYETQADIFAGEADYAFGAESQIVSNLANVWLESESFFDISGISQFGNALIFVSTWFTNFWNIGGFFTIAISTIFVLSVISFILRLRR